MIKYDFQKESKTPILDAQGMSTVLKLKKRRLQSFIPTTLLILILPNDYIYRSPFPYRSLKITGGFPKRIAESSHKIAFIHARLDKH